MKQQINEIKRMQELAGLSVNNEAFASFQNTFKDTNDEEQKQSMTRVYGDADDYPKELNTLVSTFIGASDNYAITKDGNTFNVYKYRRMLDGVGNPTPFTSIDDAKKFIQKDNR